MAHPKQILVVTTPVIEGKKILQHLKPVTAHIVAGTNVFSDVFASFTDIFGGRSQSYQKQLSSLYNEAIDKIKLAAYENGANAVVGLSIDMDEISGKNKSMFMLTAIGTAVVIDNAKDASSVPELSNKIINVSVERIKTLHKKKEILKKTSNASSELDDDAWDFITENKVKEMFPFIVSKYLSRMLQTDKGTETYKYLYGRISAFLDNLPEEERLNILYSAVLNESSEALSVGLSSFIGKLHLLNFEYLNKLLHNGDFQKQKRALQIIAHDKPFYTRDDIAAFQNMKESIQSNFKERGIRTTKKQLLSSKEKEVWQCECGKSNVMDSYHQEFCENCNKDIFGFRREEVSPQKAMDMIDYKISLISELID